MRKEFLLLTAGFIAAAWLGVSASRAEAGKKHKVVIQISSDDPKTWTLALNNVDNIISAVGKDNVDIKVVAFGPGLGIFKKENQQFADRLAASKKMCPTGVQFNSCGVTMKKAGVSQQDLAPYVDTAPSGIVRIIELEEQGYVYIRP